MCGRYALYENMEVLRLLFDLAGSEPEIEARYNIAPSQAAWVIRQGEEGRTIAPLKWGLVPGGDAGQSQPHNAPVHERPGSTRAGRPEKKPGHVPKPLTRPGGWINARSETVTQLVSFRQAFRSRRCIIPASGFYEWAARAGGKVPCYFHRKDGGPMAMAGIWEPSADSAGTFAILTTEANRLMAPVHDRMPVILEKEDFQEFLSSDQVDRITSLLRPCAEDTLVYHAVSRAVNKPAHDAPDCVQQVPEEQDLFS